jgi:hypothetical protein
MDCEVCKDGRDERQQKEREAMRDAPKVAERETKKG